MKALFRNKKRSSYQTRPISMLTKFVKIMNRVFKILDVP